MTESVCDVKSFAQNLPYLNNYSYCISGLSNIFSTEGHSDVVKADRRLHVIKQNRNGSVRYNIASIIIKNLKGT